MFYRWHVFFRFRLIAFKTVWKFAKICKKIANNHENSQQIMKNLKNRAESRRIAQKSEIFAKTAKKTRKNRKKITKNRAKNLAFSRNLVLGRRVFVWPRAFTPGLSVMGGFFEDNT